MPAIDEYSLATIPIELRFGKTQTRTSTFRSMRASQIFFTAISTPQMPILETSASLAFGYAAMTERRAG